MKKIWYSIKDIVLSYTIQYITLIITVLLYILITNNNQILLNDNLLYKYIIIGMTITIIPITIILYKKNKRKETKIDYKKLLLMFPLGISISLFYNMLTINMQSDKLLMNLSLPIIILYTSILGPIFEEIIFRYISLNKAKKVYSEKTAILLITLIFALMHNGLINVIYAFIIGLILSITYKKYNNIVYPIVIHISANFTSIFIKEYNLILLIISTILLIIYYLKAKH